MHPTRHGLHRAGLTWKKCKKLLGKANPAKREDFLRRFEALYRQMCDGRVILIYVDEAHFHRDLDLGYSWGRKGERLWQVSNCPGLSEKINWYGAYNFTQGSCLIWNEGQCNSTHTAQFLDRATEQGFLLFDGEKHSVSPKGEKAGVEFVAKSRFGPYFLWPQDFFLD